nr:sigma-70 family RNA polymerase sigma factor [Segatella baroniae]
MSNTDQESELLSLLQSGERAGFNALFRKYYQPLCSHAYQYVSFEDVEEIVQDVFLWLWQNHANLSIHTSLQAYLYRAVYLRCLSCIESQSARQRAQTQYRLQLVDTTPSGDEKLEARELLLRIQEAIDRLPPTYREAFVMHRFQNHSYKRDCAHIAGFTENSGLSHTAGVETASSGFAGLLSIRVVMYGREYVVSKLDVRQAVHVAPNEETTI